MARLNRGVEGRATLPSAWGIRMAVDPSQYFVPEADRPPGVEYPAELLILWEHGVQSVGPWRFLNQDLAKRALATLLERYGRQYFPFARCAGGDETACLIGGMGERVFSINPFTHEGGEVLEDWPDFLAWLRSAQLD